MSDDRDLLQPLTLPFTSAPADETASSDPSTAMPALALPDLYLCADGGGSHVTVAIASANGILSVGTAGACNVKTVGYRAAVDAILTATYDALAALPPSIYAGRFHDPSSSTASSPMPPLPRRIFRRVWLALAGICYDTDVEAFTPYARAAFRLPEPVSHKSGPSRHFGGDSESEEDSDDQDDALDSLLITSDGNLLAAPCTLLDVDAAVALVAGTGTIGLAFRRDGPRMDCVGVSGGWGYLLGDEGSAYGVARLAIRSLLHDNDARQSFYLQNPSSRKQPAPLLPIYRDLLLHFGVSNCGELVDKAYTDHSDPSTSSTFHSSEANRKIWIAEATRVVFKYAFGAGPDIDEPSRLVGLAIASKAVLSLVAVAVRLIGDRSVVEPSRAALSLGGSLWTVDGYVRLLEEGLAERGIEFKRIVVVGEPAEEGVRALLEQAIRRR